MQDYINKSVDINGNIGSVTVKQFDNNSRFLHVKLVDGDLPDESVKDFDLTDTAVRMAIDYGDGSFGYISGTIEDADEGVVSFLIPGSVTQKEGSFTCEIRITSPENNAVLSTKPFTLHVQKSLNADGAIEATEQYSALVETMNTVGALQSQMDALAASPAGSGGDAGTEVRDIRTGADGTEYPSAGAAVRAQIGDLQNAVTRLDGEIEAVGRTAINSWEGVRAIVREGMADKVFSVGDQFVCQRDGVNLVWDVIGIDSYTPADPQYTHSLTLQLHDCFPTVMQYDAPEALYYAESRLPAGTYQFNIPEGNNAFWYYFTTDAIPAGSQLYIGNYDSNGRPEYIYICDAVGGSSQRSIHLGRGSSDGSVLLEGTHNLQRVRYGNAIYKDSAIRQWLNSDAAAGSVWSAQNNYDRPPTWAATADGFLRGMDEDFLAVVGETSVTTVVNSSWTTTLNDRFFLLSEKQVYGSSSGEGAAYPYYSGHSDLSSAGIGADSNRMKQRGDSNQGWWLRTRESGNDYEVKVVAGSNGSVTENNATYASGVAPACNIY